MPSVLHKTCFVLIEGKYVYLRILKVTT